MYNGANLRPFLTPTIHEIGPPPTNGMMTRAPLVSLLAAAVCFNLASPHFCFEPSVIAAGDTMSPEQVAKIRSVSSVAIAENGEHIAFVLSVPRLPGSDENGSAWSELHVTSRGGESRPYITGNVSIGSVSWRPGGRDICYLSKRQGDEHTALYAIAVAGGESRRLLSHDTSIRSYSFSPDGSRVAFLASEEDSKELKALEEKGFNAEIVEEQLHFTRLWIAELGNSDSEPRQVEVQGNLSSLAWSPSGNEVVVAIAPTPLIDDYYMKRHLAVVDVDGAGIVSELENIGKLGAVAWSTDGSKLAFVSGEDLNDPAAGRLYVADRASGSVQDVLPNYNGHVSSIAWRDAKTIVFLGEEGTHTALSSVGHDGTNRRVHLAPTRVLSGLSLSKDGHSIALRSDSASHPAEVHALDLAEGGATQLERLTDSNPWLADVPLAPQRVESFKARDGLELEGILIEPLNRIEGQRYPLILAVHGGPEAHIKDGWLTGYSYPGQVAAGEGFAVFYPNYRGSTGRGVDFSKLGQADYAGAEFDDLIDAVDHLIAIGLVDKDKVGITGGSYGGFATAWCSTYHSERFAAGVMFVGISNHLSKSGTTDIPNEMFLVHARKRMWDDWQFYLERSPIFHVEKARTPLLIMHGKSDPRVHPAQSLELFRQLKTIGKTPVRLVYYPGEGHGNRKAAARYDYNLRSKRWFEHYLQGEGGEAPPHELIYPLLEKEEEDLPAN